MANNMLKDLLIAQSLLMPEGMIPFETPLALVNQSLSDFHNKQSTITINSHMISTSNLETNSSDARGGWSTFTILQTTDHLIHYIYNFQFTIAFFLKESSYAYER